MNTSCELTTALCSAPGAILFYLAEKDGSGRLLPSDAAGKAEALAWIFCQSVSERGC